MKKSVFTLLALIATIYPVRAYEYFTIFFSDGTKSETFYATDVDSICYSKLSLDSIAYDEWQVQEIYTCDSVYRYPLAQIDSLSFRDVDVINVARDIAKASTSIVPLFSKCNSINELSEYLQTIKEYKEVEDAWTDNQTLFVKIRDWGTVTFSYPPVMKSDNTTSAARSSSPLMRKASESQNISNYKACIIDQTHNDDEHSRARDVTKDLLKSYNDLGIKCETIYDPLPVFFSNTIYDYDLVFLMTHGSYDSHSNIHWLTTGEEILRSGDVNEISEKDFDALYDIAEFFFSNKYPDISADKISLGWIGEIKDGIKNCVWYTKVSEKYIASSTRKFSGKNVAVFNLACQSLMDNDHLGNVFLEKGAKCYLGYTETNTIGDQGGKHFFNNLMSGKCAYGAEQSIPNEWRTEALDDGTKPVLKLLPENAEKTKNYRITTPETLSTENQSAENKESFILKGRMNLLNIDDATSRYKTGFQYSTNSDISQAQDIEVKGKYDGSTLYMNWEKTLNESDLQPNTTYYYRSYMNDGYSNCYGEIKSFTTPGTTIPDENAEPYGVLKDSTLTFYYDNNKNVREGEVYEIKNEYSYIAPLWKDKMNKVIFDKSFSNFFPVSTNSWFFSCSSLQEIENIQYLNTSNVTDMRCMFCDCRALASLDVSCFNTSNVTDMVSMFSGCSSLTSLDLSNFNTSNVTNMVFMFSGCNSLTSLDCSNFVLKGKAGNLGLFEGLSNLKTLNLKNVNTSQATTMTNMFRGCSSLTSLDLSSFNTTNVMYMASMFADCSSLTSLDLSNFNTSNVTNMASMFSGCSSLTNLDLSSFKLADCYIGRIFRNCSSLRTIYANDWGNGGNSGAFSGCDNLAGEQGTKIGRNYYYDKWGNYCFYICGTDGIYARIDGGKDRPGLFTAK